MADVWCGRTEDMLLAGYGLPFGFCRLAAGDQSQLLKLLQGYIYLHPLACRRAYQGFWYETGLVAWLRCSERFDGELSSRQRKSQFCQLARAEAAAVEGRSGIMG